MHFRLLGVYGSVLGLLLTVVFMPKRGESSIIPLMWMLYAYISVYIPKLIYVLFSLIGRIPSLWHGKSIKLGKYVGCLSA